MIAHKTIEEVLNRADIVEVINDFVHLKRSGSNYKGLCPFHKEKTPSFVVSPGKQIFKCFGCGESGNVVSFLMKHEHLTFTEAIKWLAKKYNIEIEEIEENEEEKAKKEERESILVVNKFATTYYTNNLFFNDEGISVGLSYIRGRGFSDEIIQKFQLGYALDSHDAFTQYAMQHGYKLDTLAKAGLTIIKEDRFFDRFWGRLIFPIHSMSGQILGFAGRTLRDDKNTAKYLNSPETEIFQKRKILYGLYFAKRSITQNNKCYLVEGYTDVMAFHQAGIENTVASLGTSLTEDHVNLIHRLTENLTLIFDGDKAGIKAAMRGIDIALQEGLNLRVVALPEGEDPDSFSKKVSPADLKEFIETHETDFITFKADFLNREAQNDPIKRAEAIKDIARSIAVIPDPVKQAVFVHQASQILKINEEDLHAQVKQIFAKTIKRISRGHVDVTTPARKTPVLPSHIETSALPEEKELIYYLLRHGNRPFDEIETDNGEKIQRTVAEFIITEMSNDSLEFKNLLYREVFEEVKKLLQEGKEVGIEYFQTHPEERIQMLANELLANEYDISTIWEKRGAYVKHPHDHYREFVSRAILSFKMRIVEMEMQRLIQLMQNTPPDRLEEMEDLETRYKELIPIRQTLNNMLGNVFGHSYLFSN